MSNRPEDQPVQEGLFEATSHAHTINGDGLRGATATYTTEIIMPGESSSPASPAAPHKIVAETTDVRGRAGHMVQSLNFLAQVSMRSGFRAATNASVHRPKLAERYGEAHLDAFSEEVGSNKNNLLKAAATEFRKAYETGMGPTDTDDAEFRQAWASFYNQYNGSGNRRARDVQRTIFKQHVALEGNRMMGDQYIPEAPQLKNEEKEPGLSPRDKLVALYDAEKFLAHHKPELTEALVLSDALRSPLGVFHHIEEKVIHNRKALYARRSELRAIEKDPDQELSEEQQVELAGLTKHRIDEVGKNTEKSAALEYFDYYENARQKLAELRNLWVVVAPTVNHRITTPEAIEDEGKDPTDFEMALATVVQIMDLERIRKRGTPMHYDPLKPVEQDRGNQVHPEKNKTITDVYTAKQRSEEIFKRINDFVGEYKLYDVLPRIEAAIANEGNRMAFWNKVLDQTKGSAKRVVKDLRESTE